MVALARLGRWLPSGPELLQRRKGRPLGTAGLALRGQSLASSWPS